MNADRIDWQTAALALLAFAALAIACRIWG